MVSRREVLFHVGGDDRGDTMLRTTYTFGSNQQMPEGSMLGQQKTNKLFTTCSHWQRGQVFLSKFCTEMISANSGSSGYH